MEFNGVMEFEHSTLLLSIILAAALVILMAKMMIQGKTEKGKGLPLPPGKLGFPVIGETYQFLRAYKEFKAKEWVEERVSKYGSVFKTSLMGRRTVVLTGQEGNRFLFQNEWKMVVSTQTPTALRIFGARSILVAEEEEVHKRLRGAVMSFLKPESLKSFVGRMESVIKKHFVDHWEGKESVTVLPLMKKLTFDVACDLLFSLKDGGVKDLLSREFETLLNGVWCLPLDFPGTTFRKALNARSRICKQLVGIMERRKVEIAQGRASPEQDLLSCLVCMRDESGCPLTEEEIIDNLIVVILAGHDTTSTLLTHFVRMLALHPEVYQNVLQGKEPNEPLRWEDIQKMKYSWMVAQETLRLVPPIFGSFKKATKVIEYEGYIIPKGWQIFWVASTTHMSEDIFKEPNNFDPSHFEIQIPPYNFIPFSGGPRICPGYNFSQVETLLVLHHLVSKYKWSTMVSSERIICTPEPVPSLGLPIKLEAKSNSMV
ncbi:cytochrome P450 716B2 isoform X2 [Cryptomeria japonica]|uniref:cytochrome P450 716B2 isoform X2 n=1 Tax=Cryptomeria japonica TaxID=3369 RepID=UPI0027DA6427|nr:cytochrome P450 716B2 isoform X2 [Cryptomeria japonica]